MSERIVLKGRLAEAEADIQRLRAACENNVVIIRQTIDPYSEPEELVLDRAKVAFELLCSNQVELRTKITLTEKLKKELYG